MRCEVCWMTCVFFRVSVSVLHPRFQLCSPEPFSVPVFSPVHRIHLAAPFTSIVLLSRSPSEPYRDAFAASDADVNET